MSDDRPVRLPDFFILGAERCGTTSLNQYLKQHPEIFMPRIKEPGYFVYQDEEVPEAVGEFTTTFEAYAALFEDAPPGAVVGEASPFYLYRSRVAAPRIRELIPDPRLIVGLRNPVERAYSQYRVVVRHHNERARDFRAALDAEPERVENGADLMYHYARQSLYHEHLERYLELFGRERLHVYLFKDFEKDPVAVVQGILRFLGVDPTFVPTIRRRYNSTRRVKSRLVRRLISRPHPLKSVAGEILPQPVRRRIKTRIMRRNLRPHAIPPDVRRRLLDQFREDIRRVSGLLDLDLTAWLDEGDRSAAKRNGRSAAKRNGRRGRRSRGA